MILAVGKFEGIHRGHRALLEEVVLRAKQKGLTSAVMVFEPHPITVLDDSNYKPLFTELERTHLLDECGLDYLFVCPFDENFAALSPSDFCEKLFVELNVREIVVGEDYRFGHKRKGTLDFMRDEASKYGSDVHVFRLMEDPRGGAISTSLIRTLLSANRLSEARELLGFPFFMMGTTAKGRQLGRTLGFPTLNIYPDDNKFLLADGVYATQVHIKGKCLQSITNIGLRPTVNASEIKRSVETHVLDMLGDDFKELYNEPIKVEFLSFIRPERRFDSLDDLKKQIQLDIELR